jgi:hypothetical protein
VSPSRQHVAVDRSGAASRLLVLAIRGKAEDERALLESRNAIKQFDRLVEPIREAITPGARFRPACGHRSSAFLSSVAPTGDHARIAWRRGTRMGALGVVAPIFLGLGLVCCEAPEGGGPIADCPPRSAPVCGEPCDNPCGNGCLPCVDPGGDYCTDGAIRRCRSSCIEIIETCPAPDACAGSICAESIADCDAVRMAYENQVASQAVVAIVRTDSSGLPPGEYGPGCPNDCAVVPGDCESGLDTCWLVGWRTSEMDRLSRLYRRLGCAPLASCECPARETQLSCVGVVEADGGVHGACVKPQP